MWWGVRYALYDRIAARLPAERAAARREGLPLTPAELRATLPQVADADNAAVVYRSLLPASGAAEIDATPVELWFRARGKRRPDGTLPKTPVTPAVRVNFAALAPRLTVAERASRMPACDWGYRSTNQVQTDFRNTSQSRALVRQFSARALMRSDDGDLPGAFADVGTAARVSNHIGASPTLIALLTRIGAEAIAHQAFLRVTLSHPDDPRAVLLSRRANDAFCPVPEADFARTLNSRGVELHTSVEEFRRNPAAFYRESPRSSQDDQEDEEEAQLPPLPTGPPRMLADAWETTGVADLRAMKAVLRAHPGSLLEQYRGLEAISRRQELRKKLPGREFPSVQGSASLFAITARRTLGSTAQARLRRTLIALLEARHRSRTRTWPSTLPPAPADAPDEHTDPYTGRPLRYRTTDGGKGFVLYSVGFDFTDDGGHVGQRNGEGLRVDDITVRYP
jgi:hypothetical protein